MANPAGKTRPADQPYLTVVMPLGNGGEWRTDVLKWNTTKPDKPYASAFCRVTTPYAPGGDLGDTYWADIDGQVTYRDPVITDDMLPSHLKGGPKVAQGFSL